VFTEGVALTAPVATCRGVYVCFLGGGKVGVGVCVCLLKG